MWKNLLSTDLNQNKWTPEEDGELMRLSELFDYQNWEHIAEELNVISSKIYHSLLEIIFNAKICTNNRQACDQ